MKVTNKLNLPQAFVEAAKGSGRTPVPGRYSATELLKGPREVLLARRHADEMVEDASDAVWRIFGDAVHRILADAPEDGTEREVKLSAACGGGEVSGIFDLYDPAEGKVVDWKTTSVWKIVKGEFDDWRDQLLTYCWLISQRDGSTPCRAEIVAVLRDWSASKAGEAGYPPTQVAVVGFDFGEDEVAAHGEALAQRVDALMELEGAPDDGLPMCTPEQRWAKPDVWAVMKEGRKTAVKLFDDEEDAEKMAAAKGAGHYVELRPGTDGKCGRYCPASPFCSYWLGKQEEGGPR